MKSTPKDEDENIGYIPSKDFAGRQDRIRGKEDFDISCMVLCYEYYCDSAVVYVIGSCGKHIKCYQSQAKILLFYTIDFAYRKLFRIFFLSFV